MFDPAAHAANPCLQLSDLARLSRLVRQQCTDVCMRTAVACLAGCFDLLLDLLRLALVVWVKAGGRCQGCSCSSERRRKPGARLASLPAHVNLFACSQAGADKHRPADSPSRRRFGERHAGLLAMHCSQACANLRIWTCSALVCLPACPGSLVCAS